MGQRSQTVRSRTIRMVTDLPGPNSRVVQERWQRAVPRALPANLPVVERAVGSTVQDVDGNVFIDLTGGVGVLALGHAHPRVVAAVRAQVERFLHTDAANLPYQAYVDIAERLNRRFPGAQPARTAFFNSGAEAVENAVKIARAATGRRAVVAFTGAFHGRTLLALSLTSKADPYKAGFGPWAPEVYRAPYPYPYRCPLHDEADTADHRCGPRCFERIREAIEFAVAPGEVAAVVVEPVLGEGGVVVPPPTFLPWLRQWTERHGILLVVDEIQTGFGRTGRFWACQHGEVVPDLIAAAKAIAAGLPLSAVIGRAELMQAPGPGQLGGTFSGNPVALAAAGAVLDSLEEADLVTQAERQGAYLLQRLQTVARDHPQVGEVRGLGAMVGIEWVEDRRSKRPAPALAARYIARAREAGVLVLKAGMYDNVVRLLPPLNTPQEQLAEATEVLGRVMAELAG